MCSLVHILGNTSRGGQENSTSSQATLDLNTDLRIPNITNAQGNEGVALGNQFLSACTTKISIGVKLNPSMVHI